MTRSYSEAALEKLTKPWEEFVAFPYWDKLPKQRVAGVLQYVEWTGGPKKDPVKGTVTIGYGHTEAAGLPKIEPGMRVTEPQACQILASDLAPVEAAVHRAIKVDVTQHQYDCVVDLAFNCFSALPKVAALINAGELEAVPTKMLQYCCSGGERMVGLVHRRTAEIAWFHTPDDPEVAQSTVISPKAEREPARDLRGSKSIAAGATVSSGGALVALQAMNDAAEPIKAARDNLHELGVVELVLASYHSPFFWVGLAILVAGAFVIWDRNRKRTQDHV